MTKLKFPSSAWAALMLTFCAGACAQSQSPVAASAPAGAKSSALPPQPGYLSAWEAPESHWRLVVAPYAPHFRYSDEHRDVWAVGLERQRPDGWLAGGSYFSNSFGQPSGYLYLGKRWSNWFGQPELYTQLSGGLLYGYRGKFKTKVPFNHNGYSPGALASAGWQFNRQASLTVHLYGDAGMMFQFGWDLR